MNSRNKMLVAALKNVLKASLPESEVTITSQALTLAKVIYFSARQLTGRLGFLLLKEEKQCINFSFESKLRRTIIWL